MRVNAGRLDLTSLSTGITCVIITIDTSVWLSHPGSRETRVRIPTGCIGKQHLVTDERGARVDWLNLRTLPSGRMYHVVVYAVDGGRLDWRLSDVTPDYFERKPESGGLSRRVLGQLLRRKQ